MDGAEVARAVPRADVQLMAAVRTAAGGPANLARAFGASKQAVSEWGRVRPIPRHLRPRLEEFVRQQASEGVAALKGNDPWEELRKLVAGTQLMLTPPATKRQVGEATSAWQGMTEDERNALQNYLRNAALIAIATKQLLVTDSAARVIAILSTEVSTHVNRELLHTPLTVDRRAGAP